MPRLKLQSLTCPFESIARPQTRAIQQSRPRPANPLPIVATGPPPAPPRAAVGSARERIERRRKQAELLQENTGAASGASDASDASARNTSNDGSNGNDGSSNNGSGSNNGSNNGNDGSSSSSSSTSRASDTSTSSTSTSHPLKTTVASRLATNAARREALRKRFWKNVHVKPTEEGLYTISLDSRAVRTPHTKAPLRIPSTKAHLALAIALEWDQLTSAQQALKTHLIPLTSLAARALDIAAQDAADSANGVGMGEGEGQARKEAVTMLMRHLDTDTLLCWDPEEDNEAEKAEAVRRALDMSGGANPVSRGSTVAGLRGSTVGGAFPGSLRSSPTTSPTSNSLFGNSPLAGSATSANAPNSPRPSLRESQRATAFPIISWLTTHLWPGVSLIPALEEGGIMPSPQPEPTRELVRAWLMGLGAWELAAVERATLAGKSLCVAGRLVGEWSENLGARVAGGGSEGGSEGVSEGGTEGDTEGIGGIETSTEGSSEELIGSGREAVVTDRALRFGVEEAANACSVEVRWQTGRWGEVEDTHDVEREDLRRQFGSAVLLVAGRG